MPVARPTHFELRHDGRIVDADTEEQYGHVPMSLRSLYAAAPRLLKVLREIRDFSPASAIIVERAPDLATEIGDVIFVAEKGLESDAEAGDDTQEHCRCGGAWKFYNIGFDDGYQCQQCKRIIEVHEHRRLS